jgi:hypothetical protein
MRRVELANRLVPSVWVSLDLSIRMDKLPIKRQKIIGESGLDGVTIKRMLRRMV